MLLFVFIGGVVLALNTVASGRQAPAPAPQGQSVQGPQSLHLIAGRSLLITSPVPVRRISLADPNIADAIIVSPQQILLNGKIPGASSLLIWDENDQSQAFDIYVDLDILALKQKIHEVFPNEPVEVEASKDTVMLSGKVSSKAVADKIYTVVSAAAPKVISLMETPPEPPPQEVLLEVRFAEVDLGKLDQLGINVFTLPNGDNTFSTATTGQFGGLAPSITTGPPPVYSVAFGQALNLFLYRTDLNAGLLIQDLQQKNVLQILAEPNLLAESGKDSSFLVGGQFPVPVVQGGAAGSVPTVTILFKEFGIKLDFRPELTDDGKIHMKVAPEVSTLDYTNAITLSGFVIPALSTRRVESEMILADGQSFAIAGLEDNRVTETISKMPGLADIPILGNLFKSKSNNRTRTDLIVFVTPHIVKPLQGNPTTTVPFPEPFIQPTPSNKGVPVPDSGRQP